MTTTQAKGRVFRFDAVLEGWTPAGEVFPITNENSQIIGAFTVSDGPIWKCFVSARGSYEALMITSGDKFYLTPILTSDGSITELRVSMFKVNDDSKSMTAEGELSNED